MVIAHDHLVPSVAAAKDALQTFHRIVPTVPVEHDDVHFSLTTGGHGGVEAEISWVGSTLRTFGHKRGLRRGSPPWELPTMNHLGNGIGFGYW